MDCPQTDHRGRVIRHGDPTQPHCKWCFDGTGFANPGHGFVGAKGGDFCLDQLRKTNPALYTAKVEAFRHGSAKKDDTPAVTAAPATAQANVSSLVDAAVQSRFVALLNDSNAFAALSESYDATPTANSATTPPFDFDALSANGTDPLSLAAEGTSDSS